MAFKHSTKFMFGIGVIVFAAVGSMSVFFYQYVKTLYIEETYQKTDLVLGHIDATMEYIRDELRPAMYHVLPKDEFVLEAMSTSFVNKGVMSRFADLFPAYIYRRVALNPMNPQNRADPMEAKYIETFSREPNGRLDWKGMIDKKGREYFIHLQAVVMKKECAVCHGDPSVSPKSLLQRYGASHGHNWRVGDVVGLESIAIPMDVTFYRIRQVALAIFLAGLTGMALLTLFLNYFYYFVTQRPLRRTSAFFKSVARGEKGLDVRFEARGQDEISELADSFNRMIEHLRHSQEELLASEFKYRRIFESSKDAIVVADCTGLLRDINNSGLDLLGFADHSVVIGELRLHDLFVEETAFDKFIRRLDTDGYVKDFETVFRRGQPGEANVLITATYSGGDPADVCDYECIIKDITERKRLEVQLRQAERLASIGQLAAGVAHEINNPLSIVIGYAKLLREDTAAPSLPEDLDAIYNNACSCQKIVEDLLNFSRRTRTRQTKVDIHATIESAVALVEGNFADGGVNIRREYDPQLGEATLDMGKMQQVFMNLLMNAYQAMEHGGSITIVTRDDPAGGYWISFTDTGSGIADDIGDMVFDPFFTTKEPGQGTGLGLAVSYGIIKEHRGEITFESEVGVGTTFRIWLPADERIDDTQEEEIGT